MQYINDDMDELFRRAAEDYPLNTDSADWNVVLKKISDENTGITAGNDKKSQKYKRLLLLLLLLPALWLGKEYFYQSAGEDRKAVNESVSKKKLSSSKPDMGIQPGNLTTPGIMQVLTVDKSAPVELIDQNNNSSHNKGSLQTTFSTPVIDHMIEPDKPAFPAIQNESDKSMAGTDHDVAVTEKKNSNENSTVQQDDNKNEDSKIVSSKGKLPKQKEHGIYAGLAVGPDISTVKFQSIKTAGFSIGVVLGYQLNKSISIETGIAWNKKYYHSDGKYFNAKNIVLPTYSKVKELDGTCEMLEVPVTVRYNFRSTAKEDLSVAGGLSSYIMKRENYDYTIDRNGVQYPRKADYKNSSTDLFAVVNAGVAYNRKLGKKTALRLEPYIKIPIRGVGIGELPIMSTGINIAVTKKLFK